MNILIPDSWLREHIKTKATLAQIAKYLSLCSQSVERIKKVNGDSIYDIEITTNRPDCLSIIGIARELFAVLPRFGIPAKLITKTHPEVALKSRKKGLPLKVKIKNPKLCSRFSAIILDNITIKPSPKIIRERLKKAGVRAINNIVDVGNYLMLETGQPIHTFDYDKIRGATMILRESRPNEKITTLDGVTRKLPGGDIVIEDAAKRLIDLCGIMGGQNTEINPNTKRVLLFVQAYDPTKIRKTCMGLAHRTEAASRFEKGIDTENVTPVLWQGVKMLQKNAQARVASDLTDIYPKSYRPKKVTLDLEFAANRIGVKIPIKQIKKILASLDFSVKATKKSLTAAVPSHRAQDVSIPEDLIEEIARVFGFHNLPSNLPEGKLPQKGKDPYFGLESKVKHTLKNWGFTEIYTYSMVSKKDLKLARFDPEKSLPLKNPLGKQWALMRPSLIPSMFNTISQNLSHKTELSLFEIAKIYLPKNEDLPDEKPILVLAQTGSRYLRLKGVLEALFEELSVDNTQFSPLKHQFPLWHPARTAQVTRGKNFLGVIGQIRPQILKTFEIKGNVTLVNLDFGLLVKLASVKKVYQALPKYPPVIEDLAFTVRPQTYVQPLIEKIKKTDPLIKKVVLFDSYKNTRTFRVYCQSPKSSLTDKRVSRVRKKVIKNLKKLNATLKT